MGLSGDRPAFGDGKSTVRSGTGSPVNQMVSDCADDSHLVTGPYMWSRAEWEKPMTEELARRSRRSAAETKPVAALHDRA